MTNRRISPPCERQELTVLLPWYVNGSIGEDERQRVDAHLPACPSCRDALAQERYVYQGVNAEPCVEYMPATSLKRLQARLDGVDASARADAPPDLPAAEKPGRWSVPWPGLAAAAIAVMAVAVTLLAADRWVQFRARAPAPKYYTVTSSVARPPGEVIRAVFTQTITLTELQSILDSAQLRIVSGPTEAGVYSLAANSHRPVSSSLALLRAHANVRFAESTEPSAGPGDSP